MVAGRPRRRRRRCSPRSRASRPTCAGSRPSASRSWPRSTAPRSAAASRSRSPATTGSPYDDPRTELGLPEVTLGLLPGGGGVTRVVRMLGLTDGADGRAAPGHAVQAGRRRWRRGSSTSSSPRPRRAGPAAKAWILAHRDDDEAAVQPWDRAGLPDARRHPVDPEAGRVPAGVPGQPAQADQGRELSRRRGRSCPRPSRARRSTSTPRPGSSRATSPG